MDQPPDHIDASALIDEARTGETQAVSRLLEHYRPYVRMLARLAASQRLQAKYDESDLVQETLFRVQCDVVKFQGKTEPELASWLRRIMATVSGKQIRHYSRQRRDAALEQQIADNFARSSQMVGRGLIAAELSPSEQVVQRERAVLLAQALDRLAPDHREALIINRLEGMTIAQTADRMGRSADSVKKLLARGVLELKRQLNGRL